MADPKAPAPSNVETDVKQLGEAAGNFVTKEMHDKRFKQILLWVGAWVLSLILVFVGYEKLVAEPAQAALLAKSEKVEQDALQTKALTEAFVETWKAQNKNMASTLDASLQAHNWVKEPVGGTK